MRWAVAWQMRTCALSSIVHRPWSGALLLPCCCRHHTATRCNFAAVVLQTWGSHGIASTLSRRNMKRAAVDARVVDGRCVARPWHTVQQHSKKPEASPQITE